MKFTAGHKTIGRAAACAALAAAIFWLDVVAPLGPAAGLGYVLVVLIALGFGDRRWVLGTAAACVGLLLLEPVVQGQLAGDGEPVNWLALWGNRLLGLATTAAATALGLQRQQARQQQSLLETDFAQREKQRAAELEKLQHALKVELARRHKAEAALREAEALYESLFESLPLNIVRKDLDGRVVMANRRCCETTGRKLEELMGKTDTDLYPKELAEKYRQDDLEVIRAGQVFEDVERHRRPSGELLYMQVFKSPVRDAAGRIVGVQAMFWDMTARRRAEESLLQERYLLRSLMDNVPDAIYFKDVKGKFIRINRGLAQKFLLADPQYAEGKTDFDFFSREHSVPAYRDEQKIMQTGAGFVNQEEQETWPDGRVRWVSTTKMPLRDKDGRVVGTFGISRDVTDRKLAEEALRENAERMRLIVDTAYDAFVAMDDQGRITDWNPRAAAIFGWSREEAIGRSVAETIIPERYRELHRRGLATFLETGEGPLLNSRREATAIRRDGTEFDVEITITPVRRGDTFVFNAFLHDITERKRAQAELEQAKEAAVAASQAKSVFLANMSHEIRTPLNAVLGMTELVLDTPLTPVQREYLTVVQEAGDSLLGIIGDILDFSKIEAGHLALDESTFLLREFLHDTLRAMALRAHHKGLELACRVAPDVPDEVVGDPVRLRQVTLNLLGNAVKFTEQGEVFLNVTCEEQDGEHAQLHFAVQDTGIGIAPDKHESIFEAFEQADNTHTRKFGGTGLGLAISSRLVHLMHGRIWLDSVVGRGTTFHFTAQVGKSATTIAPAEPEPPQLHDLPVLVVDDNATTRDVLGEMLETWHMQPILAASAAEAWKKWSPVPENGRPYPLVVCDASMPGEDGFDFIRKLQADPRAAAHPPRVIMMLTPGDRLGDVTKCERLGVAAYLMKPVEPSELFDAIMLGLGLKSLEAETDGDPKLPAPQESIRPLKILLAEDSLVNQKLAVGLMAKHGHSVAIANNGKEALAALERDTFDLVLMDVQMPELDGHDTTRAIRAREKATGKHIPIVAMTAHALKGDRELCLQAGMDGYVTKPVRAKELFAAIAEVLGEAAHVPAEAARPTNGRGVVDWTVALEAVQGDRDLLKTLVEAFLEESPQLIADIRTRITAQDGPGLQLAAHRLKGSMRYFAATRAFDTAYTLETQGRTGELENTAAPLAALEAELAQLTPELQEFLRG